jgi:hypothetical protein
MTEKEWKHVQTILRHMEDLKCEKRLCIASVQNYFRLNDGATMSFPSACKQPMSNILCAYYDREIAMVQAQLDAIEIKFGNPDDNSQSDTGV